MGGSGGDFGADQVALEREHRLVGFGEDGIRWYMRGGNGRAIAANGHVFRWRTDIAGKLRVKRASQLPPND